MVDVMTILLTVLRMSVNTDPTGEKTQICTHSAFRALSSNEIVPSMSGLRTSEGFPTHQPSSIQNRNINLLTIPLRILSIPRHRGSNRLDDINTFDDLVERSGCVEVWHDVALVGLVGE